MTVQITAAAEVAAPGIVNQVLNVGFGICLNEENKAENATLQVSGWVKNKGRLTRNKGLRRPQCNKTRILYQSLVLGKRNEQ
jgi:hypothetical protein